MYYLFKNKLIRVFENFAPKKGAVDINNNSIFFLIFKLNKMETNQTGIEGKGPHNTHWTYELNKLLICLTCWQLTGAGDWNRLHDPNNRVQRSALRRAYVLSGKQDADNEEMLKARQERYGNPI